MSEVAFFFLFFLHGTSIGNGQQGISYNGWVFAKAACRYFNLSRMFIAAFANTVLPVVRLISRNFIMKTETFFIKTFKRGN